MAKYKGEFEKREQEKKVKQERLNKKEKKERHWAMLRWVTTFIEENQDNWERRRREQLREREEEREKEEWQSLSKDQRIQRLREEEGKVRNKIQTGREERLKTAIELKNIWNKRRKEEEEESKPDTETAEGVDEDVGEEQARLAQEMEEVEWMEQGDLIGDIDKFCTDCAMTPCSCLLLYLDLKLNKLNQESKEPWELERRRREQWQRPNRGWGRCWTPASSPPRRG